MLLLICCLLLDVLNIGQLLIQSEMLNNENKENIYAYTNSNVHAGTQIKDSGPTVW